MDVLSSISEISIAPQKYNNALDRKTCKWRNNNARIIPIAECIHIPQLYIVWLMENGWEISPEYGERKKPTINF